MFLNATSSIKCFLIKLLAFFKDFQFRITAEPQGHGEEKSIIIRFTK